MRREASKSSYFAAVARGACAGALVGGLFVYAFLSFHSRYAVTHNPDPVPNPSSVVAVSLSRPDETPIRSSEAYTVAADKPRVITLPSISSTGFIQEVGVDSQHAMVAPTNVHLAGWYSRDVKPGEAGLAIIDGHVQGTYEPGIFKKLDALKPGDTYDIEFGDHSVRTFSVVSVHTYSLEQAQTALFKHDPAIARQLNLITCGGTYEGSGTGYDKRVVVVSSYVGTEAQH